MIPNMKTVSRMLLAATIVFMSMPAFARPAIGIGPRVGLVLDDGSFSLGAEARMAIVPISSSLRLDVRPSFDFYFVGSDATLLGGAVDGLLAFNLNNPSVEPYIIAGLAVIYTNTEPPNEFSSTDVGINLGAGAKFVTQGKFQPFAELRVSIYDQSFFAVAIGVLMQL